MRHYLAPLGWLVALVLLAACGDDGQPAENGQPTAPASPTLESAINPADFQAAVDNPFFPLAALATMVYEGAETDPDTGEVVQLRVESTVLAETDVVAGVEVTVVEVKDYENGQLVESTLDYYAQRLDGTVYYLGERVDDYEDGRVVGHSGQWLAGEGDALPGIFMPADPALGDEFEQERAPGLAEDRSRVVAVDQAVSTPAGEFSGCIRTEDFDPLSGATEFKYYCPGVGLVKEESEEGQTLIELISL